MTGREAAQAYCDDPRHDNPNVPTRTILNDHFERALAASPSDVVGVDAAAARMAAVNGLDWSERCAIEAGADECDSSTCIAAHDENHDPEQCRDLYRSLARAALSAHQDARS